MSINKINNTPILFSITNHLHDDVVFNYISNLGFNKQLTTKINNKTYNDLFIIDGNDFNKEHADLLHKFFYEPCTEEFNIKIVIVYNIDKVSKQIQNTFLKELEEPNSNIYIFLTTSKLENVLDTIKSRCLINLDSFNKNVNYDFDKFNSYKKQLLLTFNTWAKIDEFLKSTESNSVLKIINFFLNIDSEIYNLKDISDLFKKLDYKYINIILLCLLGVSNEIDLTINQILSNINLNISKLLIFNKILLLFLKE